MAKHAGSEATIHRSTEPANPRPNHNTKLASFQFDRQNAPTLISNGRNQWNC